MDGKEGKKSANVDIYRDTPVRLLGYANEVGESFRSLVSVRVVNLSYGLAFGYCLADTVDRSIKRKQDFKFDDATRNAHVLITAADTLTWQILASVLIPGFTINRICYATKIILLRYSSMTNNRLKWTTTATGLCSIPLIVRPIDHLVDWFMEKTCRKYYTIDQQKSDQ